MDSLLDGLDLADGRVLRRHPRCCSSAWRSGNTHRPGGSPRLGILRLDTTRGDRLFISLLGSAFIHLAWLGLVGPNLWWALALSVVYADRRVPLRIEGETVGAAACRRRSDRTET